MSKLTKFFILYTFIGMTGLIISSLYTVRLLTSANTQTAKEVSNLKQEVERLNAQLDSSGQLMENLEKIKSELSVSKANQETLGTQSAAISKPSLGFVSTADGYPAIDIYEKTSFSSKVLGQMTSKKAYRYLKKENSWYLIQVEEELEGWVNSRFVKEIQDAQ